MEIIEREVGRGRNRCCSYTACGHGFQQEIQDPVWVLLRGDRLRFNSWYMQINLIIYLVKIGFMHPKTVVSWDTHNVYVKISEPMSESVFDVSARKNNCTRFKMSILSRVRLLQESTKIFLLRKLELLLRITKDFVHVNNNKVLYFFLFLFRRGNKKRKKWNKFE